MKEISLPPRIIAFTKDWDDVPTSTTHVLRHMAQTLPVLWVNSIGTRKPRLNEPVHLRRMLRRMGRVFHPIEHKENRLWVFTPLLVPGARSGWAKRLNFGLFWCTARRWLEIMGRGPLEIWCFVPNAVDLLPTRYAGAEPLVVYYCTDDWSGFRYLDGAWLAGCEKELLRRAKLVFAASMFLFEKLRGGAGAKVHYTPHGVEYEKFARALDLAIRVPDDIAKLPHPVIGFYGNIYPWIDFDLILCLARQRPHWSFVLIGGTFCNTGQLNGQKNVYLLGQREHDELPSYCAGFDAAFIPYDMSDPRMQSVSPVKVREMLAAGIPVATADIPELRGLSPYVVACRSLPEWISALERLMREKDRFAISHSVSGDSWSNRVRELRRMVEQARNGHA